MPRTIFIATASFLAVSTTTLLGFGPASPQEAMNDDGMFDGMGMSDDGMSMGGGMEETTTFSPKQIEFFESKIRPLLVSQCGGCHSEAGGRLRGGLSLDTREKMLIGGKSGGVIVPGDPDSSLLITAVRYEDPEWEMPPRGPLSSDDVALLEEWVRMGAPFPGSESGPAGVAPGTEHRWTPEDIEQGRMHWSYQPLTAPDRPAVSDPEWAWQPLDHFVLAAMDERGTSPVRDADRETWLRRVKFDLVGLPPTPEEIESFKKDASNRAHERIVDQLLASPAFGERWGRHWLDVARYAESSGKDSNVLYPHAWRYRDYVIEAFNNDKPFDRFIREQLAGDLLPARNDREEASNLIATGFLAIGVKGHNTRNRAQFTADLVDEQIDAVTQGFLGTTVACARCHDHKFDPIPQRDYYAIAGIFGSTDTRYGTQRSQGNNHAAELIDLPRNIGLPAGAAVSPEGRSLLTTFHENAIEQAQQYEELQKVIRDSRRNGTPITSEVQRAFNRSRNAAGMVRNTTEMLERFDEDGNPTDANMVCMGVQEGRVSNAPFLERGEVTRPGDRIPRGFVQVISGDWAPKVRSGSGRMQLADWIASSQNPLTPRVWANRTWLHLFGDGIVTTPDNFGASGRSPTNQPLLDHLANRFIELDYSIKGLIREIVLSHTYRLSSTYDKANASIDPEIVTLWRMPKRRMEAEAIRDAMLFTAGTLELEPPVGSAAGIFQGTVSGRQAERVLAQFDGRFDQYRSVYMPIVRDRVPEALGVFDFPDTTFVAGDRDDTNVATQALFLMNSDNVIELSDAFARRVMGEARDTRDRIKLAFQLAYGRDPSSNEFIACRDFLREFPRTYQAERNREQPATERRSRRFRGRDRIRNNNTRSAGSTQVPADFAAWSALCQTLYQSAEFRILD